MWTLLHSYEVFLWFMWGVNCKACSDVGVESKGSAPCLAIGLPLSPGCPSDFGRLGWAPTDYWLGIPQSYQGIPRVLLSGSRKKALNRSRHASYVNVKQRSKRVWPIEWPDTRPPYNPVWGIITPLVWCCWSRGFQRELWLPNTIHSSRVQPMAGLVCCHMLRNGGARTSICEPETKFELRTQLLGSNSVLYLTCFDNSFYKAALW